MTELFTNTDGANMASGAGPMESITGMLDSMAGGAPIAVGGQMAGLGLQALGFMDNPLQTLATSAIGWLLEHLGPLNLFLDVTMGDPAAVDDAAKQFVAAATQLDALAREHAGSLSCDLPTYFGAAAGTGDVSKSARAFHGAMSTRFEDLRTASAACSGIASLITISGEVVALTRGIFRDMLAEFAWQRLEKAGAMMAAAPLTFGGAAGWFLADSMVAQASTMGQMYRNLLDMLARLKTIAEKMKAMSAVLAKVLKSPLRQSVISNALAETGKAMNNIVYQDRPDSAASAEMPDLPPTPEEKAKQQQKPAFPQDPPKPVYGPTSNAKWTTSGTLDE
jgi:hypothetical protein